MAIGFVADLGPLKTWGFELQRNQIVVDPITMATNIPGVYGAGDIVAYPAKFKLIATGAAEAVTAVNHAVTFYDPKARLDAGHSTTIMEKRRRWPTRPWRVPSRTSESENSVDYTRAGRGNCPSPLSCDT